MAIDWTKIYEKYKGLWVALLDDEITVVGSGKTAKEAWEQAQKRGYKKPILTRMPEKLIPYVGFALHEI
ncbi:MAG: hypothetical protein HY506_00150 [Candidatus Yanofskybacteria bacterium]|nr:hypothetical protein [Candidatus Yanofskybacteria bacterium]